MSDVLTIRDTVRETAPSSKRVSVCLAALRFYPVIAGPAMRFQRYAPGLRDRGIDLHVFTCWEPAAGEVEAASAQPSPDGVRSVQDLNGTTVFRADTPCSKGHRIWRTYGPLLVRHCRRRDTRPAVIQFLSLNGWSLWSLMRLRRAGVPLVFTQTMVRAAPGGPLARAAKDLLWSAPLQLMDRIVVSSNVMRDELLARGVRPGIEVIPNGVDLDRFRPCASEGERESVRRRIGIEPTAELVLFIGHLSHRKGVDVLAAAWSRIAAERPAARLLLINPGNDREPEDPAFRDALDRSLRASGAFDRTTLIGAVDNVEDYFRAADVFAFPSRREGMPNVIPEAFASGVPCVVAPFTGLPAEFGTPGGEFLLVDRTPDAFAEAVISLLRDGSARYALGRRARKWAEKHLGVGTSLDRYAALYRELARMRSVNGTAFANRNFQ